MKTVVISGGSSGIGLATASKFSEADYLVYSLRDISSPLKSVKNLVHINCDVTKVSNINSAAIEIKKSTSDIHALICNAGVHFSSSIEDTNEDDFDKVVAINLKGSFFTELGRYFFPS